METLLIIAIGVAIAIGSVVDASRQSRPKHTVESWR